MLGGGASVAFGISMHGDRYSCHSAQHAYTKKPESGTVAYPNVLVGVGFSCDLVLLRVGCDNGCAIVPLVPWQFTFVFRCS
jgi:hypothetical protein